MMHSPELSSRPSGPSSKSLKRSLTADEEDDTGDRATKRTRGRTGCLNCRRRRKKCDELKPTCTKCKSRAEECKWDTGVTFKWSGLDAQHPSMLQAKTRKRSNQAEFRIVDVTFDSAGASSKTTKGGTDVSTNGVDSKRSTWQDDAASSQSQPRESVESTSNFLSPVGDSAVSIDTSRKSIREPIPNQCQSFPYECANSADNHEEELHRSLTGDCATKVDSHGIVGSMSHSEASTSHKFSGTTSTALSDSSATTATPRTSRPPPHNGNGIFPSDDCSIELEVLDYLTSQPSSAGMMAEPVKPNDPESFAWSPTMPRAQRSSPYSAGLVNGDSPDNYAIYYPNAMYKELHSTLHQHMVEAARKTTMSQQLASNVQTSDSAATFTDLRLNGDVSSTSFQPSVAPNVARPLGCTKLVKRRQLELWRNYLEEIAVWLDMFDNERHFQYTIPGMAKTADHLHYAILALSARQMERKDPSKPYTESLGLYQDAIQLIVRDLHSLDTAVITSCVLLCVLEMMSSSPRAWGRHLDGCAMLLEAAGINGVVGGVRQALFWCFARMDVWGGFLGDTLTKIPTSRWFMSGSMSTAVNRFKGRSGGDSFANYAVFLCASVVNVISNRTATTADPNGTSDNHVSYAARWKALFELLEDWYNSRPEEMQPLMSYPSILDDYSHPFPMVLYSTSPAVNGNQLYHASAILMLQEKPRDAKLPKSPKSILWHARQICGIAAENHHHGPWINALQPLWIAGKVMSHATEHQAILDILARIERETGWATAWRAQDLREHWGTGEA